MGFTTLEKDFLAIKPIDVGGLLHGIVINKNEDGVTYCDLYRVESDLESQITNLKTKLNDVIRSINVVIERQ